MLTFDMNSFFRSTLRGLDVLRTAAAAEAGGRRGGAAAGQIPRCFPALQELTLVTGVPDEVMLSAEVLVLRREHYHGLSSVNGPHDAGFPFKFHRQRCYLAVFEQLQLDMAGNPVTTSENIPRIRRRLVRDAETFHCARHDLSVVQHCGRVKTKPIENLKKKKAGRLPRWLWLASGTFLSLCIDGNGGCAPPPDHAPLRHSPRPRFIMS